MQVGDVRTATTAPFQMKGNAYQGIEEFLVRTIPGGMPAVCARMSAAGRAFFAQRFIAGGWYDVMPVDELTRTSAAMLGLPHEELCRRVGAAILERDASGVYRAILRLASPDLIVRALPYTTKRYFDFVSLQVEHMGTREYRVIVSGIPRGIIHAYVNITTVFIVHALEGAGARQLSYETSTPRPQGMMKKHPVMTFERHFRWT